MHIFLNILGLLAQLVLILILTEFLRNLICGTVFGLIERRQGVARLSQLPQFVELRNLSHLKGGQFSIPLSIGLGLLLRIIFWSKGNFRLLDIVVPIGISLMLGTFLSVRFFRKGLKAAGIKTDVREDRQRLQTKISSGPVTSARATQKKIPITTYWESGYVECPKCNASWNIDENPIVIRGSSVLMDMCPKCGAHILINTLETIYAVVESFNTEAEMEQRLMSLTGSRF